ncbi:SRPBCC family protein [Conexibacter woesei]|uniref:Activator of Hsp90 ATPase 1 family protein n=1 Tax=Conexibacter woesei (strain DSM 14684 / CCUG 47730 / CIP 108061 / JCM 11494 / NBRC 100937 / ID131577) TaxID=469383 RepID=D3F748_CONWI|nr:SRPBCC domain-containing protein [Conexibacter woesei]ADB48819.1 Activator of Hsp90 ATPase 1 family protein [Conexibacter woesei DSM 14684]
MYREFVVRWEDVVPGDPQQVWDAVTRRAAGWIWEIEFEPRVGGAERGLSPAGGTVTAWDPPRRFATRAEAPDGWRNELDYTLEPHAGGTRVRYVHTSVAGDDYDVVLDGCVQHTDFYRHSLSEYVAHFAGRDGAYVGVDTTEPVAALRTRLGLPGDAAVGDRVRLTPAGVEPVEGVVDYLTPYFLGVRTGDAFFRVYGRDAWDAPSTVALHLFGAGADPRRVEQAWRGWLSAAEAVA